MLPCRGGEACVPPWPWRLCCRGLYQRQYINWTQRSHKFQRRRVKQIRSTHFLMAERTVQTQTELDDVDLTWATRLTVVSLLGAVPREIWIIPFRILQRRRAWVGAVHELGAGATLWFSMGFSLDFIGLYASTSPRLTASFSSCLYGNFQGVAWLWCNR